MKQAARILHTRQEDTTHDCTMKVKVTERMQLTVTVFHQETPEQFLNHVQVTLETISQRGLDTDYQLAIKETWRLRRS